MISIVIPVYNEEKNLNELCNRLIKASQQWDDTFEVILVDNGSIDNSLDIIKQIHKRDSRFKAMA